MKSVATTVERVHFEVVRRGYETNSVDTFLTSLASGITSLEDQLRQAQGKLASLEKEITEVREREAAAQAAYVAAAEAKQKLLTEAEARAAKLVRDAEQQAEASRHPADAERIRRDAESILLRAKKQLKAAERERTAAVSEAETRALQGTDGADRLVADSEDRALAIVNSAKAEGRNIVTEARRIALETVAGSQRDAEDLIVATRLEQSGVVEHLRALKQAVADMLEHGAESSELIRVVLSDEVDPAESQSVAAQPTEEAAATA